MYSPDEERLHRLGCFSWPILKKEGLRVSIPMAYDVACYLLDKEEARSGLKASLPPLKGNLVNFSPEVALNQDDLQADQEALPFLFVQYLNNISILEVSALYSFIFLFGPYQTNHLN